MASVDLVLGPDKDRPPPPTASSSAGRAADGSRGEEDHLDGTTIMMTNMPQEGGNGDLQDLSSSLINAPQNNQAANGPRAESPIDLMLQEGGSWLDFAAQIAKHYRSTSAPGHAGGGSGTTPTGIVNNNHHHNTAASNTNSDSLLDSYGLLTNDEQNHTSSPTSDLDDAVDLVESSSVNCDHHLNTTTTNTNNATTITAQNHQNSLRSTKCDPTTTPGAGAVDGDEASLPSSILDDDYEPPTSSNGVLHPVVVVNNSELAGNLEGLHLSNHHTTNHNHQQHNNNNPSVSNSSVAMEVESVTGGMCGSNCGSTLGGESNSGGVSPSHTSSSSISPHSFTPESMLHHVRHHHLHHPHQPGHHRRVSISSSTQGIACSSGLTDETMKLKSRDKSLYGLCPARDPVWFVRCPKCQMVIKPQALLNHMKRRHSTAPVVQNHLHHNHGNASSSTASVNATSSSSGSNHNRKQTFKLLSDDSPDGVEDVHQDLDDGDDDLDEELTNDSFSDSLLEASNNSRPRSRAGLVKRFGPNSKNLSRGKKGSGGGGSDSSSNSMLKTSLLDQRLTDQQHHGGSRTHSPSIPTVVIEMNRGAAGGGGAGGGKIDAHQMNGLPGSGMGQVKYAVRQGGLGSGGGSNSRSDSPQQQGPSGPQLGPVLKISNGKVTQITHPVRSNVAASSDDRKPLCDTSTLQISTASSTTSSSLSNQSIAPAKQRLNAGSMIDSSSTPPNTSTSTATSVPSSSSLFNANLKLNDLLSSGPTSTSSSSVGLSSFLPLHNQPLQVTVTAKSDLTTATPTSGLMISSNQNQSSKATSTTSSSTTPTQPSASVPTQVTLNNNSAATSTLTKNSDQHQPNTGDPVKNVPNGSSLLVTKPKGKNKSDANKPKFLPCKDRQYNPDQHCGVVGEGSEKPCTRSLTCKTHSLSLRRKVEGRSKTFDELLNEHKAAREAEDRAKGKEIKPNKKQLAQMKKQEDLHQIDLGTDTTSCDTNSSKMSAVKPTTGKKKSTNNNNANTALTNNPATVQLSSIQDPKTINVISTAGQNGTLMQGRVLHPGSVPVRRISATGRAQQQTRQIPDHATLQGIALRLKPDTLDKKSAMKGKMRFHPRPAAVCQFGMRNVISYTASLTRGVVPSRKGVQQQNGTKGQCDYKPMTMTPNVTIHRLLSRKSDQTYSALRNGLYSNHANSILSCVRDSTELMHIKGGDQSESLLNNNVQPRTLSQIQSHADMTRRHDPPAQHIPQHQTSDYQTIRTSSVNQANFISAQQTSATNQHGRTIPGQPHLAQSSSADHQQQMQYNPSGRVTMTGPSSGSMQITAQRVPSRAGAMPSHFGSMPGPSTPTRHLSVTTPSPTPSNIMNMLMEEKPPNTPQPMSQPMSASSYTAPQTPTMGGILQTGGSDSNSTNHAIRRLSVASNGSMSGPLGVAPSPVPPPQPPTPTVVSSSIIANNPNLCSMLASPTSIVGVGSNLFNSFNNSNSSNGPHGGLVLNNSSGTTGGSYLAHQLQSPTNSLPAMSPHTPLMPPMTPNSSITMTPTHGHPPPGTPPGMQMSMMQMTTGAGGMKRPYPSTDSPSTQNSSNSSLQSPSAATSPSKRLIVDPHPTPPLHSQLPGPGHGPQPTSMSSSHSPVTQQQQQHHNQGVSPSIASAIKQKIEKRAAAQQQAQQQAAAASASVVGSVQTNQQQTMMVNTGTASPANSGMLMSQLNSPTSSRYTQGSVSQTSSRSSSFSSPVNHHPAQQQQIITSIPSSIQQQIQQNSAILTSNQGNTISVNITTSSAGTIIGQHAGSDHQQFQNINIDQHELQQLLLNHSNQQQGVMSGNNQGGGIIMVPVTGPMLQQHIAQQNQLQHHPQQQQMTMSMITSQDLAQMQQQQQQHQQQSQMQTNIIGPQVSLATCNMQQMQQHQYTALHQQQQTGGVNMVQIQQTGVGVVPMGQQPQLQNTFY